MSEIQDRCVVLKNIPFTCEERDVRETLDFAHGDFRFMGKYEKLHKHIEFGNDVRWIVLFMFKRDAIRCITDGSWISNAVRGGCRVEPDYCSGCIIPDEWLEDKTEDEEWDMAGSVRTRDCDVDTSDDFMNSFVNVKHKKNLTYDDIENSENDGELGVANVTSVDLHHEREKPIPAKRSTVKRKEFDEIGNETTRFQNQFESLIADFEGISSDDIFGSGNDVEHMHAGKVELDSYKQSFPNTLRSSESKCLSGERISTSELFGSGGVQPDRKEKEDITIDKDKEDISKSANERSSVFASKRDDENSKERLYKRESGRTEEVLSDELFGSGSIQYEEKEKKNTSIVRQKENSDTLVTERSLAKEKDQEELASNEHETRDGVSDTKLKNYGRKMMSDSKNLRNYNNDDKVTKRKSSGDLFESSDRNENVNTQYFDDMLEPKTENGIDMEHIANASVRSADLFGSTHESMELKNKKDLDEIDEANVEQATGNAVNDTKSEADKLKISEEQAVETGSAAYSSGVGLTPPIYHSMPYSPYMMMYPNPQGASNMNYGQYMTMMPPSQNQPNATSPENDNSPACMNAMYQMPPYPWPMQMPVQGQEKGQQMYQFMPFPVMMPPMQVDEQGKPLQNPPGMMMQQGYFMPYVHGQHQFIPNLQQSTEKESNRYKEGQISPNSDSNVPNDKANISDNSKPRTHDFVNNSNDKKENSNDTKENNYDVPKSKPRSLTRQKSKGSSENTKVYSYARESKSDILSEVRGDDIDVEPKYSPLRKKEDFEDRIYDEIDEDQLKSIVSAQAPEPPSTHPPSNTRSPCKKKDQVPVYFDNESQNGRTENDDIESKSIEKRSPTILVTGISAEMSKDAIELFFENKKKTGGGEIVSTTINEKKREAKIEFKEIKDAMEVVRRAQCGEEFILLGCTLHVSEYQPPPVDRYRVFIKGIAETTTSELITNFIAAQIRSEPLSVTRGETHGTALVSFETPPDIAKLREVCEKRKCEGKNWDISEVELVRSIKVEGLNGQISTDALSLYFENKRRSKGGDVESVNFRENKEDYIVTFRCSEDAERVCQVEHEINNQKFKVSTYHPCLELDEDFIVKVPPPVELDDLDFYIVKFIINSKPFQRSLEKRLSQSYGEIIWPTAENVSDTNIRIVCTVDEKDPQGHVKVKSWKEKCVAAAKEDTKCLIVEKSRNVAVEVWSDLVARLREIDVPHPESIAVFLESSNCAIVMVGERGQVQNMAYRVEEIINEIEKKIDDENQTVTKRKKLMTYEMALFRASKLEGTLKKMVEELDIDNEKKEIMFKGKQKDVNSVLEKLDKKMKSFVKRPVPGITRQMINLLFKTEARNVVRKKMIAEKIIGVWNVIKETTLIMYSGNEKDLDIAVEILQSSIIMDSISLDEKTSEILSSNEGKAKITEFENNYQGCVLFEVVPAEMRFACICNIHQEIKDEFTKLFDLHSVISKFIETEPGTLSYLITYKKRDIELIERQYQRLAVVIEIKDNRRRPGFLVKGKKDGCKLAIDKLQTLIDSVVREDHTVSWPGFDKFIQSSEGRSSINTIEVMEKCVIKVSSEVLSSGLESTIQGATASKEAEYQKASGGRIAKVVKVGTLASEKVDVIVNSTNSSLDLNIGAVSRTLLKAGGDIIDRDCKKKYGDGIKPGEVAVTTGGALACNELYHGMLVKWDNGQGLAERVMANFIKCCLTLASTSGYTSIAFPALGTGAMGFPADIVASTMFETVDAFDVKNPKTSLREVKFVVWSEDKVTVRAFKDVESRKVLRRSSDVGNKYRQSETADNLIVKNKGYSTTIGPVSLSIVKDDLTTFTSGAIVNSTMDDLNLNSGAISRAILVAAGSTIQNEALLRRLEFLRDGFVVTSPGRLLCKNIIHVRARSSLDGWAESIKKCLMETERLGLNSVAFPALGTGGKGISADRMAKTMITAFQDYVKSADFQRCLKAIRIVIFEERMLDTFIMETKAEMDTEKPAKRKSFLPDFKFWEKKTPETADAPTVTLHIYCDSKYHMTLVVNKIKQIRQEIEVFVPRIFLEHMDEKLKSDLRRIGSSLGVKVVVDKSRVLVMGYGKLAQNVTTKLEEYIDKIAQELRKSSVASSVKLPAVWSKMKLTDPTRIERLRPSAADYAAVSQRFLAETGYAPACIVSIERIQNPTLFTQYAGKKKQIELLNSSGKMIERVLWHGTKSTAVDNIKSKGFDRNYNSGSSHGVGVYFAVNARMSASGYCSPDAQGNKYIFLAHVLTGDFCVGRGGIRVPPLKPASVIETYDSTTDNVQNPNFFVIFHDAQAYPSYLVTFK